MDKLWWRQIPNASRFISSIVGMLSEGKNVFLVIPEQIPWYDTFKNDFEIAQRQELGSYGIDTIKDDLEVDPGKILLDSYCKKELVDDYRPAIGYAKFLSEQDSIPLNNAIVWVRVDDSNRAEKWGEFVSNYASNTVEKSTRGLFVIEIINSIDISDYKMVYGIDYQDYISKFDCYIYSILASSMLNESKVIKEYLAELCTTVVCDDIELVEHCVNIRKYKEFLKNPFKIINSIIDKERRSDGGVFSSIYNRQVVDKAIWDAQVKCLFPIIESYRDCFIKKYYQKISEKMPISSSSGEIYDKPEDVEIGTLYFMICSNLISVSTDDFEKTKMFKEARNKLAHLDVLSFDEVKKITITI